MSDWVATNSQGAVIWRDGVWIATPKNYRTHLDEQMALPFISATPIGPVFAPEAEPEQALLAVVLHSDAETSFAGQPPLDDIIPDVPPGAVS